MISYNYSTSTAQEYGIVCRQKQNRLTDLDFADDIAIQAEEENVCQEMTTKLEDHNWTEYKQGENEGHGNHPASIITTNSCCTREY